MKAASARWPRRALLGLGLSAAVLGPCTGAWASAYYAQYGLAPASPAVDLGVQPLGIPSGVISAVMRRDRTLKRALAELQQPLRTHAFQRGADMVELLNTRRLEAGLLGDMPTILAASSAAVWIVGLVKQTSTAIVTKGDIQVAELVGKRIGYVENSSAHHTLLQGLASVGLDETQVRLVPLRIDEMPDALERGEIDAFAAWEPGPSIALGNSERNRICFRGLSTDYFVIEREFVKRSPQTARYLVAGFYRAINWMRGAQNHVNTGAQWALADAQAFLGKAQSVSPDRIVAITRREILNIPSAPVISNRTEVLPLSKEYAFLEKLNKLPAGATRANLETAFRYEGLAQVLAEPAKYRLNVFDYDD